MAGDDFLQELIEDRKSPHVADEHEKAHKGQQQTVIHPGKNRPYGLALLLTIVGLLVLDRSIFARVDYSLPSFWAPPGPQTCRKSGLPWTQSASPACRGFGYSTCHWCHVMAHESYEDQETAELLNRWFISVKVDRE